MIRKRIVPGTDIALSEISLGCMSLAPDQDQNTRLIHAAYAGGINYFDTSDLYEFGANEERVGMALKPFRKEVFLATKVGNEPNERGDGWRWNPSKNYILKAVDKSLKRLQTDYIDLYQLHGGTIEDNMEEVVEAFELLKEEGKILHYGLSSIRPNVIRHYAENAHLLTNMLQYNMLDRRPEESVLPSLAHAGVGVLVRGALAKGFLLLRNKRISLDIASKDVDSLVVKLKLFSTEKRRLMHLALQWVLRRQEVTSAVVGVRTEEQLEDLLSFVHSPQWTVEALESLTVDLPPYFYTNHR